jgi:hypothetical protein
MQIIFAETDGVARAGCATCPVAFCELVDGVVGFGLLQLVRLRMHANPAKARNVLC